MYRYCQLSRRRPPPNSPTGGHGGKRAISRCIQMNLMQRFYSSLPRGQWRLKDSGWQWLFMRGWRLKNVARNLLRANSCMFGCMGFIQARAGTDCRLCTPHRANAQCRPIQRSHMPFHSGLKWQREPYIARSTEVSEHRPNSFHVYCFNLLILVLITGTSGVLIFDTNSQLRNAC